MKESSLCNFISSEEEELFPASAPQIVQSPLPMNSLFSLSYFCKNWKKKVQVQTSSLDTAEARVESLCNLGSPSIAGNFSPFK